MKRALHYGGTHQLHHLPENKKNFMNNLLNSQRPLTGGIPWSESRRACEGINSPVNMDGDVPNTRTLVESYINEANTWRNGRHGQTNDYGEDNVEG